MAASAMALSWFIHQLTCAFESFLERPGDDRKVNLQGLLLEYQEAVRLGQIELPTMTRSHKTIY